MKLKDAKVGDKVKLPLDPYNSFTMGYSGSEIKAGKYLIATVLEQSSYDTLVAWNDNKATETYGQEYLTKTKAEATRLDKKARSLSKQLPYAMKLNAEVHCEMVSSTKEGSSAFPLLLALVGIGAGISTMAKAKGNSSVKTGSLHAN